MLLTAGSTTHASPIRVLIVGDSIRPQGSFGISGEEPASAFWDQLPQLLGPGFEVIDAACRGASSIDWSLTNPGHLCPGSGLPSDPFVPDGLYQELVVPQLPADVATVLLGTNDAVGFLEPDSIPVLPDAYEAAVNELVDSLLTGGVRSVILMTPSKIANPPALLNLSAYRERLLSRCAARRAALPFHAA
jgi:hypothetical protein